ncbi:hypothetical protein J2S74_002212 [Evansella vedderi]|uniref:Uncharacterized protein n=1 Tax=Evansella vedderi TaxID=38282 RepID=A0ABT9ZUC2_9BACI|nr:hypothetical protein [Evansella vedderi]MDQ0254833.1 hypothetical protein [Evansella vedderi]
MINEEMDTEVHLPVFEDLDISFVYVTYYNNGDARYVDIHYSEDVDEEVVEIREYQDRKFLYGPYDLDTVIMYTFDKGIIGNVTGERIIVNDIEVVMQETVTEDLFQFHLFVVNDNRYVIGYKRDFFTWEEAMERTKEIINSMENEMEFS